MEGDGFNRFEQRTYNGMRREVWKSENELGFLIRGILWPLPCGKKGLDFVGDFEGVAWNLMPS